MFQQGDTIIKYRQTFKRLGCFPVLTFGGIFLLSSGFISFDAWFTAPSSSRGTPGGCCEASLSKSRVKKASDNVN